MTHAYILAVALMLGLAATPIRAQQPGERKVRIEISRTEDGRTTNETREFQLGHGEDLERTLRDLGIWDELRAIDVGEDLHFDLRRMRDGGPLDEMAVALSMTDPARWAGQDTAPRAFLGVSMAPYRGSTGKGRRDTPLQGATITQITPGSPAEQAGLRVGDVIIAVDGSPTPGPAEVTMAIRAHRPGDAARITVLRNGQERDEKVTLGAREAERETRLFAFSDTASFPWRMGPRAFLGVNGGPPADGGPGALVSSVVPGSAAGTMGLREGDVITAINGEAIADFAALSTHIATMEPGAAVELTVKRDGRTIALSGTLGERGPRAYRWSAPSMSDEDRDALRQDMDELRRDMDRLRREIRGEVLRELRVTVEAAELTEEDKALLRGKGVSSIDHQLELADLRIAPNPADGFFRIQFTAPERGDLTVDVHDASGERIYQERIIGFKGRYERTLDLSDRASGTYFLVVGQHEKVVTRKLVKR